MDRPMQAVVISADLIESSFAEIAVAFITGGSGKGYMEVLGRSTRPVWDGAAIYACCKAMAGSILDERTRNELRSTACCVVAATYFQRNAICQLAPPFLRRYRGQQMGRPLECFISEPSCWPPGRGSGHIVGHSYVGPKRHSGNAGELRPRSRPVFTYVPSAESF